MELWRGSSTRWLKYCSTYFCALEKIGRNCSGTLTVSRGVLRTQVPAWSQSPEPCRDRYLSPRIFAFLGLPLRHVSVIRRFPESRSAFHYEFYRDAKVEFLSCRKSAEYHTSSWSAPVLWTNQNLHHRDTEAQKKPRRFLILGTRGRSIIFRFQSAAGGDISTIKIRSRLRRRSK